MERLEPAPDDFHERTGEAPKNSLSGQCSRHSLLRTRTKHAHAELDQFTIRSGFFDTRGAYLSYLKGLSRFHAAYEAAAAACDLHAWRAEWRIDRHGSWIAEELASAGANQAGAQCSSGVRGFQLNGAAPLLGSLYVLAGSTLGARMLHRLTMERAIPRAGGSLYLFAVSQSLRWPDFLAFLESASIDGDEAGMVAGALMTFRAVHDCLEAAR